jgi:hypothetical protein
MQAAILKALTECWSNVHARFQQESRYLPQTWWNMSKPLPRMHHYTSKEGCAVRVLMYLCSSTPFSIEQRSNALSLEICSPAPGTYMRERYYVALTRGKAALKHPVARGVNATI